MLLQREEGEVCVKGYSLFYGDLVCWRCSASRQVWSECSKNSGHGTDRKCDFMWESFVRRQFPHYWVSLSLLVSAPPESVFYTPLSNRLRSAWQNTHTFTIPRFLTCFFFFPPVKYLQSVREVPKLFVPPLIKHMTHQQATNSRMLVRRAEKFTVRGRPCRTKVHEEENDKLSTICLKVKPVVFVNSPQ